jgi:hypothetical protein
MTPTEGTLLSIAVQVLFTVLPILLLNARFLSLTSPYDLGSPFGVGQKIFADASGPSGV